MRVLPQNRNNINPPNRTHLHQPLVRFSRTQLTSMAPGAESTRVISIGDPNQTYNQHHHHRHPTNAISTSKYNLLTFIPRNLYEQFRRVAYIYFFFLACLNQVPQLQVSGGFTSFVPLGIVLVLTALKDAYEDYQRHKSDTEQNNREALVFNQETHSFVPKKWKEICPGEIVKICNDESFPCDLVLLSSSDPSGSAYIQTINLDGETNLKTRYALHQFAGRGPESWNGSAVLKFEAPNLNIYGFQGSIEVEDGGEISLGPNNIVLRGCKVKNTEWVFGVAVYVGMETKVMLNNSGAPSKRSRLETQMNREIIILAVGMVVMCSLATTLAGFILKNDQDVLDLLPYYRRKDY